MTLYIKRVAFTDTATFGVLLDHTGIPFALTGELPWKSNQVGLSCIPAGEYTCKRVQAPHFGGTFEVLAVPHRSHILFHKGNVPHKDSKGCILVGEQYGYIGSEVAVLASGSGYSEFMGKLYGVDTFTLVITGE